MKRFKRSASIPGPSYKWRNNYIRQRSWANVMYSPLFVCLCVCLFVCLLAGLLKRLWTDLNEISSDISYPRTIPLNFGGDPDSGSGFRIQNIIFLKAFSTQSLFLRAPYVDQERSESLCGETHNGKC